MVACVDSTCLLSHIKPPPNSRVHPCVLPWYAQSQTHPVFVIEKHAALVLRVAQYAGHVSAAPGAHCDTHSRDANNHCDERVICMLLVVCFVVYIVRMAPPPARGWGVGGCAGYVPSVFVMCI